MHVCAVMYPPSNSNPNPNLIIWVEARAYVRLLERELARRGVDVASLAAHVPKANLESFPVPSDRSTEL